MFLSFYQAYSKIGRITWYFFLNFRIYRGFFKIRDIKSYVPESEIRAITGEDSLLAFNMGTKGLEQKITCLCFVERDKSYVFVKYGTSLESMKNIENEWETLNKIKHLEFVPRVLGFSKDNSRVILKTTILNGTRININHPSEPILNRLIRLSQISEINLDFGPIKCFAHGDFCPWNMVDIRGEIYIYDWEMSGEFILGYDLFTYVFQTRFLVRPKDGIELIIGQNIYFINEYFMHFNIKNWKEYLVQFATLKMNLESVKGSKLCCKYKILLDFAKKI